MKIRILAIALSMFLAACGSDLETNDGGPWEFEADRNGAPQPGDDDEVDDGLGDVEPTECSTDDDCPGEFECAAPSSCGGTRRCVEEAPVCSAAPPFPVCSCDGMVRSASAGCPGPYAWDTGFLAAWDATETSTPCDPSASPPFTFDVTAQVEFEEDIGDGVLLAKAGGSDTSSTPKVVEVSETGTFEIELVGDEHTSFGFVLLLDRDGDGECDPETDTDFSTLAEADVDLETFDVDVRLSAREETREPCSRWFAV